MGLLGPATSTYKYKSSAEATSVLAVFSACVIPHGFVSADSRLSEQKTGQQPDVAVRVRHIQIAHTCRSFVLEKGPAVRFNWQRP